MVIMREARYCITYPIQVCSHVSQARHMVNVMLHRRVDFIGSGDHYLRGVFRRGGLW
jgi:hypothetical protein